MTRTQEHLEKGAAWEQEIYLSLQRRARLAWVVAGVSMATSLLAAGALIIVMPLKEPVPYVITVDKHSGYLEITQPLKDGPLAKEAAIRDYDLARYVTLREGYIVSMLAESYNTIQAMSEGQAAKDHKELWGDGAQNPSTILGEKGNVEVRIHSVTPLNEKTASVRFSRKVKQGSTVVSNGTFTAIITYRYSNEGQTNEQRLKNPLGFKVTNYTITEEIPQ